MKQPILNWSLLLGVAALTLASCGKSPEDPGTEYAPQMYHAIAYDPYSQVTDTASENYNTIELNGTKSNQRVPAANTIHRKNWYGMQKNALANELMVYHIPADSLSYAAKVLKSPFPQDSAIALQGKVLYERYCSPCHGTEGKGNGPVGEKYKGVPAYNTGTVKDATEGHIFHVITHGKGRMWPHGSQINPDERWKIVQYVQKLQKQS